MKYTYGTSIAAARRLEDISAFFNPAATTFIRRHLNGPVDCVLDIGCGPGFSTDMLLRAISCSRAFGLDNSDFFIQLAKNRFPYCWFIEHNILYTPFPVSADVMYTRFVLSHLAEPVDRVNRWVEQLPPNGLFFIDELEAIDTDIAVFKRYLEINTGLVRSQGAELFVGQILADGRYGAEVLCNESARLPVENARAAGWFLPNTLTIWEDGPYVKDNVSEAERKEIADELARIKSSGDTRRQIIWTMRRMVLRRY